MTNANFQTVAFKELDGLFTEINEVTTPPNSLALTKNTVATREGKLQARPALPVIWNLPPPYGNTQAFSPNSLFYIPLSVNSFIFTYQNTGFSDDIGNFADTTNFVFNTARYIIDGVTLTNFTLFPYLKPIFSWSIFFPIPSFSNSNTVSIFTNLYLNAANGVFRTTGPTVTDITLANFNSFKKVNVPLVNTFTVRLATTLEMTDADRWFKSGFAADFVAILNEQININQILEGKPTRVNKLINIGTTGAVIMNISVDDTNIDLTQGFIEIYRTLQYDPSKASPTVYYKCYEVELNAGTIGGGAVAFQALLNLNDDTIQFNNDQLYTSQGQLGPTNVNTAPPVSNDFLIHQNYATYSNIMRPPFSSLVFTALPANGIDTLKIGATTVTLMYTANSTVAPANTGVIDNTSGTFRGQSDNGGFHYNLFIKPIDATTNGPPNDFSVPFYAVASSVVPTNPANSVSDITVTPFVGALFDISKFSENGGIVAIISTVTSPFVVGLFSYQKYTANIAAGTWVFNSCAAAGNPFSGWAFAAGTFYLYVIDASTFTAIPIYSSATASTGFSILPNFELYPTRPFNNVPVGRCTEFFTSGGLVFSDIEFFGIYTQSSSQQLDTVARNFTDGYNAIRLPEDPYIDYDPLDLGKITIISQYAGYNPLSTYTTNPTFTSGNGFYDEIKASINVGALVKFDKFLTSIATNIMEDNPQVVNGITFSKVGIPEACSLSQVLNPFLIGSPLNPILKVISIYDKLFVFKQEEGTYRIVLEEGPIVAAASSIQLIDNTSWLLLENSVQAWEEGAIFFSNRGFCFITGNGDVNPISPSIEKEALNLFQIMSDKGVTGNVKSFILPDARIYGCYFPDVNIDGTGIVYVYNMFKKKWTSWASEIIAATVKGGGQLTIFYPIWNFSNSYVYTSDYELEFLPVDYGIKDWIQLRQFPEIQNASNQVDEQIPLTSATITLLNNTYTITSTGVLNPYQNIYKYFETMKSKDVYYNSASFGLILMKIVNAVLDTSISLQPVDPTIILPAPVPANDIILGGVNTELYFNKFYPSSPEGGGLTHFNEIQGLITEGVILTNLRFLFFGFGMNGNIVIDNVGNIVIDNSGNIVVTSLPSFFDLSIVFQIPLVNSYFRTYLPLDVLRGRYLQYAMRHSTPYEIFYLTSLVFKYKDIRSIKSKISDTIIGSIPK